MRHTAESKALLSEARKGEKNPFFGRKHTPETKAKLAKVLRENRPGIGFGLSPVKVKVPSGVELGYFAGIVDGEGSIRVIKKTRPFLAVYNTSQLLMDWLVDRVGGGIVSTDRRGRLPCMTWRVDGARDVYALCVALEPLLIAKRDDVRLVIEFLDAKYKEVIRG
jgi:hypothetical protein